MGGRSGLGEVRARRPVSDGGALGGDHAVAVGVREVVVDPVAASGMPSMLSSRRPMTVSCSLPSLSCSGRRRASRGTRSSSCICWSCWNVGETTFGSSRRVARRGVGVGAQLASLSALLVARVVRRPRRRRCRTRRASPRCSSRCTALPWPARSAGPGTSGRSPGRARRSGSPRAPSGRSRSPAAARCAARAWRRTAARR